MARFGDPAFEFPDLDELGIEKLEQDTVQLTAIVAETASETADFLCKEMKNELEGKIRDKDKSTGAALDSITSENAKIRGDTVTARAGALHIRGKDKKGFHLVYLENGSPTRAATPWFAPVADRVGEIYAFIKRKLKEKGLPIK